MPGIFLNILTELADTNLINSVRQISTSLHLNPWKILFLFHKEVEAQWGLIICLGLQA